MSEAIYRVTRYDLARSAADRWRQQYCLGRRGWTEMPFGDPQVKHRALMRLGENPEPDDVNRVIGNESWTELKCDTCEANCQTVVAIKPPDSERGALYLCGRCAGQAVAEVCRPDAVRS